MKNFIKILWIVGIILAVILLYYFFGDMLMQQAIGSGSSYSASSGMGSGGI